MSLKCLRCSSDKFDEQHVQFKPTVRGVAVEVSALAFVCVVCGGVLMNDIQMNVLRKEAADVYKRRHGLLTSCEIVAFRERLNMSQREFAAYLSLGVASIKRYETYYVQDKSQDELIRLKCDCSYAQANAIRVCSVVCSVVC